MRRPARCISAKNFVTTTWATRHRPEDGPADRESRCAVRRDRQSGHRAARRAGRARVASRCHSVRRRGSCTSPQWRPTRVDQGTARASSRSRWPRTRACSSRCRRMRSRSNCRARAQSQLVAWDPVKQREAWRSPVLGTIGSGTLATAGGLVFQGTQQGPLRCVSRDRWPRAVVDGSADRRRRRRQRRSSSMASSTSP